MSDDISAIEGTRRTAKEMADGTLRISIDIEPRHKKEFHRLFPDIDMPVAIAPLKLINNVDELDTTIVMDGTDVTNDYFVIKCSPEWPGDILYTEGKVVDEVMKRMYGQQARELRQSDFFRRPEVWRAVGTAEEFHAWIQDQKCVVCGKQDYVGMDTGDMKCEAAHVRRAGESGTGYKSDYSIVPMCRNDHALQHQYGESSVYQAADQPLAETEAENVQLGKDWLNKKRIEYVQQWCWEALKYQLSYDSWANVPPWILRDWADEHDVSGSDGNLWLPLSYYENYLEEK